MPIDYIVPLSHLFPLGLFFLSLKKCLKENILKVLFVYSAYSFLNDYLSIYLTSLGTSHQFNIISILWSLFTAVEFTLFALAIYYTLKTPIFKKIILATIPLFLILTFVVYFISKQQQNGFDAYSITVEYIILILFTLLYFYEEMSAPKTTFIYQSYQFWNIVGILIYSTGTFFLFMYSNSLQKEDWENWSVINYIFTLFKNMLFSVAILTLVKSRQDSTPQRQFFEERINYF